MSNTDDRTSLAGHATDLQWMMALDGLRLGVDESHPNPNKHHITMEPGGIALQGVHEGRIRILCEGLDELEAYTLRYILQHPGCTLGEVMFSKGPDKPDSISPKQMQDVAEKLSAEGRIHLTRRWVVDAVSPSEKREKEEMESLESQEYLRGLQRTNPEQIRKWEESGLIKRVPTPPHEPPASER